LRRVLVLDQAHDQAREALARLLVTQARGRATAGDRTGARALATEAVQVLPKSPMVWLTLVAITDDQTERIEGLRRAADLSPEDSQIRTRLRQALLARGVMVSTTDRVEARARFREAAALNPADVRVWLALANLADSPEDRVQSLRDLLRAVPDHAGGRLALRNALASDAEALAAIGRLEEASARWREAIEATGGDVETWLGLAASTPDQHEAEDAVQAAYDLNPTDERVAAAMDRLRGPQIDPGTIEAPADAFARFTSEPDLEPGADPGTDIDSSLDTFAQLPDVMAPSPVLIEASRAHALPPAAPAASTPPDPIETPALIPDPAPPVLAAPLDQPTPLVDAALVQPAPQPVVTVFERHSEAPVVADEPSSLDLTLLDRVALPDDDLHTTSQRAQSAEAETIVEPSAPPEAAAFGPPPSAEPVFEPPVTAPVELAVVAEPAAPPTPTLDATPSDATRRTVMIVDDSPTIRKILGLTLERAGYTVLSEPDGEAAMERLLQVVPDLILLDIAMPKIDGYEVCKRIKQDPRTAAVPVVMLSGKDALFDKVKGHLAGAAQYLTKPFETPAVLAVVTSYCQPAAEAVHG
jgi:twitching motility two-component system response regulator PilG